MAILRTVPATAVQSATAVLFAHGELRLLATRAFGAGEVIDRLQGEVCGIRTRQSVEIAWGQHLCAPEGCSFEELMARYWWRFLNHSCRPNTVVRGRDFVAAAPIEAYEELCFDYETTEWEIAEPFTCRCIGCDERQIRGFRHLGSDERDARVSVLAPHLLERLAWE